MLSFGGKSYLQTLASTLHFRIDQYMIAMLLNPTQVGYYAIAVNLTNLLLKIPDATGTVLFPRLAGAGDRDAHAVTSRVCRNTLFISILAGLGVCAVSPIAIKVLFGDQYYPDALWPLILLMPGIVAASATRVLGSFLFSQGKVLYTTIATAVALGMTIALDLIAVPLFEVEGAAAVSSISYVAALIVTLYFYARVSGGSIGDALLWHPSDREHYLRIVRRFRDRSAPAEPLDDDEPDEDRNGELSPQPPGLPQ